MSKMIKCPNCGADIDETLSKCPYCGYINIEGAEDQYMDKLEDMRSKLDVVDDEARDEYKKGLFKPLKVIIIVSVIVFVIFCVGLLLSARIDKINKDSSTHTGEDTLAEMKWEKEHYALYDELLESGEYDLSSGKLKLGYHEVFEVLNTSEVKGWLRPVWNACKDKERPYTDGLKAVFKHGAPLAEQDIYGDRQ